jgi:hypothetical protein
VNLIVERALQVSEDLAHARSRRAFLSALEHFERMLVLAPDFPPGCLAQSDCDALSALADTVIAQVEERLDRHTDRAAVQHALATRIYQIRRDVEIVSTMLRDTARNPPRVSEQPLPRQGINVPRRQGLDPRADQSR